MNLVSAEKMRELDRRAIEEFGVPGAVLMENAGRGTVDHLERRFGPLAPGPVLVMAGKGNNGGDGFVIARHLANRGWQVQIVALAERKDYSGDAAVNLEILLRTGCKVRFVDSQAPLADTLKAVGEVALLVDALLGTGLSSNVRGVYSQAIDWINESRLPVVAVDIPSGVDATSGQVFGKGVRADLTVTFARVKVGQVIQSGADLVGELALIDIGIPGECRVEGEGDLVLVDALEARGLLPPRPRGGHKGTFGHLLVVGGSVGKSGAAALAAEGGVRGGAGLVTLACPASIQPVLAAKLTEVMTASLTEVDGAVSMQALEEISSLWQGKQALAVGPGLGRQLEVDGMIHRLLRECPLPMVVDADGLNALAGRTDILKGRKGPPPILTPHPGEMARLTGKTVASVEADRIASARQFAKEFGVVLVLKGARTVTAFPNGRVRINSTGGPALATGGTGDVLTGVIGGLLAQGMEPGSAAVLGVFLHGLAADRWSSRIGSAGMAATDLLPEIPGARGQIEKG